MDLGSEEVVNFLSFFCFVCLFLLGFFLVQSTVPGLCWEPDLASEFHHTEFFRGSKISVKSCGKAFPYIIPLFFFAIYGPLK